MYYYYTYFPWKKLTDSKNQVFVFYIIREIEIREREIFFNHHLH